MTSALSCPDLLGLLTPRWRSRARCPTSVKMWQPWIPFLLRLQRPISAYPSGIPSGWDPSLLIFALRSPMALSSSPMANHKSAKMQLVARRTLRSGRLIWLMFNMKQCINWGEGQGSAPMASNNGNWTQLYWKRRVFPKLKKTELAKVASVILFAPVLWPLLSVLRCSVGETHRPTHLKWWHCYTKKMTNSLILMKMSVGVILKLFF